MEITGRITADALVYDVKGGKSVVDFSIAISDSYRSRGESKRVVTYVRCAWWRNKGIAPFLRKGLLVGLYGRMSPHAYINREGEAVGALRFTAADIKFLGGNTGREAVKTAGQGKQPSGVVKAAGDTQGDDLPF